MGTYNGFVASFTGVTTTNSVGTTIAQAVPSRHFISAQFAGWALTGVSGKVGIRIIGNIGGATYVIAGVTNIAAAGSFPIPLLTYQGISGTQAPQGCPRPSAVLFEQGSAGGATNSFGITASVFMSATY